MLYVDGHTGVTNLLAILAAITCPDKGTYGTSMPTNKLSIKGAKRENATAFMPGMEMTSATEGGKGVRRRVWEELSTSVLVCKEEDQGSRKEHDELLTDNFQLRDVVIEGRHGLDVKKSLCQRIHSGRRSETGIYCNVV